MLTIDRQKLLFLYMAEVSEIANKCENKSIFQPQEIVGLICDILEENNSLVIDK